MSPAAFAPALDPTARLLVALSRVRPEPEVEAAEFDRVDRERLLSLAARLGNFSLIARRVLARDRGLPQELARRTERQLAHIDVRTRLAEADVAELARALARAGHALVLLKGPAYERFLYPARGLRTSVDIDVLVAPEAVEPARAALLGMGFTARQDVAGSIDFLRRVGDSPLQVVIELHTDLVHLYEYPWYRAALALEERRLIARSEPRELDGAAVRVLCAADELVYSVVHFFFHHDLTGLRYHSDLQALLSDPVRPLVAGEAIAAARSARADLAVGLTLLVHEALFGPAAVPAELLAGLAPRGVRRALLAAVLPPFARLPFVPSRAAGHPAKILAAPGLAAPLELFRHWLFPGRRYLQAFYGLEDRAWRPSYHVRYPAAIVRKALRHAVAGGGA